MNRYLHPNIKHYQTVAQFDGAGRGTIVKANVIKADIFFKKVIYFFSKELFFNLEIKEIHPEYITTMASLGSRELGFLKIRYQTL